MPDDKDTSIVAPPPPEAAHAAEPKAIMLRDGKLVPEDDRGLWRLAKAAFKSELLPQSIKTEAQAFIMIAAGFEVGLSLGQTLKGVMVVNNRPALWGDIALALVRRHHEFGGIREWYEFEGDKLTAFCEIKRKGEEHPTIGTFSVGDARRAGLWDKAGPWKNYPSRMLKMRARAFAMRDSFPDALGGLSLAEEMEDVDETPRRGEDRAASARSSIERIGGSVAVAPVVADPPVDVEVEREPEPANEPPEPEEEPPADIAPKPALFDKRRGGPVTNSDIDAAFGKKAK